MKHIFQTDLATCRRDTKRERIAMGNQDQNRDRNPQQGDPRQRDDAQQSQRNQQGGAQQGGQSNKQADQGRSNPDRDKQQR
jgi:hypothetical protein